MFTPNQFLSRFVHHHHMPLSLSHIDATNANTVDTEANGIIVTDNAAIAIV